MEPTHAAYDAATRGIVFDIQRFALHDGPGIRTTVSLKGCPLSCIWCHNPESRSFRPQLSYNAQRCRHCLKCVLACPTDALTAAPDGSLVVARAACSACGACISECSEEALAIIGMEMTAGDVMQEVLRDADYYRRSGGITLSGGEPLAQPRFALALLRVAKENGLHTCLDTSGAVDPRRLQDVLPFVDLYLYDYKATDDAEHKWLTGVSNALILENLDYLYSKGAEIILRCPLVPGVNDNENHLRAIAEIERRFPHLAGVEIMAYHDLGRDKAVRLGLDNPLHDLPSADAATKSAWLDAVRAFGSTRVAIG